MQASLKACFSKGSKRKREIEQKEAQLNQQKKQKPKNSFLASLKEANSAVLKSTWKPQPVTTQSQASKSTQVQNQSVATMNSRGSIGSASTIAASQHSRIFGQRMSSNISQSQQTFRPSQSASAPSQRSSSFFAKLAQRNIEATAAWEAGKDAKKRAAARMQQQRVQAQPRAAAHPPAFQDHFGRVKDLGAMHNEAVNRKPKQQMNEHVARSAAYMREERKAKAEAREKGFTTDTMWPRNNFEGFQFGNDYEAYKKWEEENKAKRQGYSLEDGDGEGQQRLEDFLENLARAAREREFADDPDDTWGFPRGTTSTQTSNISEEDDEDDDFETVYDEFEQENGPEGGRRNSFYGDDDILGSDGEEEEFSGANWEDFKRNWYRHSREHHHDWYYTGEGPGGSSGSGPTNGGGVSRPSTAVVICHTSALNAVKAAWEAAQLQVQGEEHETVLKGQIQSHILQAAEHCGNEMDAFARALRLHLDSNLPPERVKKIARQKLLLTFHPDKLARASKMEQWLGTCVTQVVTSVRVR